MAGVPATWFAGSWCDVCAHPSGYAFVVATDSQTLTAYIGTGAALPVVAWTQTLPEPINWPRCAVDGSGNIAALGQGGNTNQALFVQNGSTSYFGLATVQRPCFLSFEDGGFVGYICHDSFTYVRWPLAGSEPASVRNPFSGGSVLGIVDVRNRKPIWAQATDTANGGSGGYYQTTILGNVFQLPMTRGSVTVGQAIGAPYTAEAILAQVGPYALSTVIAMQGFDPRVAAITGTSSSVICARTLGTSSGAAALMIGPDWPAFDGSISASGQTAGLPYQAAVIDPRTGKFTDVWYRAILNTASNALQSFTAQSTSDQGSGAPSFGKLALPTGPLVEATKPNDTLTLTSTDTTIGYTGAVKSVDLQVVPQGPDTAVQFNDNGTLYGDANFTFDKNTHHANVTGDGANSPLTTNTGVPDVVSVNVGAAGISLDSEFIANQEIARASTQSYVFNDTSSQATKVGSSTNETPGSPTTYAEWSEIQIFPAQDRSEGRIAGADHAGAHPGKSIGADRNAAGSGAASTLGLQQLDGTDKFIWFDATGAPRYGPARPTENGSVSDTSGTLFGTGSGTVTHTGALTANELIVGNSGADIKAVAATDGQIPIGKSSDGSVTLATLTAGSNVTITNGPGTITIASTGGGGSGVDGWIEGVFRAVGDGSTTTFNLPDVAESLLLTSDDGAIVDPLLYTLGSSRDTIVFGTAPTSGHVLQINYELASA